MNRLVLSGLSLSLLSMVLLSSASARAEAPSDSPVVRRAKELIETINASDNGAAERFVRETYGGEFAKMPMDAHLGFIAQARDRSRGLEYVGVQDETPTEAVVIVRRKLTGDAIGLMVKVEPDPPHKITGIGRRPLKEANGAAAATGPVSPEQLVRDLDAHVAKLAENDLFSGVVLLADGDRPLLLKAYGLANRDFAVPNKTDTKFNLASMNKMFTAVAVAQLVEQGKLSFDDPLSKFLPDYPSTDAAERIRIKHLLAHASGLGDYLDKLHDIPPGRLRTIDAMLDAARDANLAFEPGERFDYSNTGFLVLGKVIEKASGQDYYAYVREHVYQPAGMTNTDSYEMDRVTPNLAVGYHKRFRDDGTHEWTNNLFEHVVRGGPAGGGYSTAEDLMRFADALRTHKLLGAEMTRTILSPKPEPHNPGYGYGFEIEGGSGLVGHGGGFPGISSGLFFRPQGGPTVVILANMSGAAPPVFSKFQELVGGTGAPGR
jgi:CubicO group peptidase (beta-lactamase class C family)